MDIVAPAHTGRKRNFERRNAQTSRKGWKPRWNTMGQLAKDIADSIRQHEGRVPEHYTDDPQLLAMIHEAMGK